MSFPRLISVMRSVSFVASMAVVAVGIASAQSAVSPSPLNGSSSADSGYSSSNQLQLAEMPAPAGLAALPSAPSAASSAAGGQGSGGGWRHSLADKLRSNLARIQCPGFTMQVSTSGSTASARPHSLRTWSIFPILCGLLLLPISWRARRKALSTILSLALLALLAGGIVSCTSSGGGTGGGTGGGGGSGGV